jgi:hypothetical protein
MVPFLGEPQPVQALSAEIEFRQLIGYMARYFTDVQKAQDLEADPKFDLSGLERILRRGFQNRTKEEFTKDSAFADHWFIHKHHLNKGNWKKAATFAQAHEALIFGHFEGNPLPKSSVTMLDGVGVATWENLLKKNSKNPYWKTKRTLADYAKENKEIILALKGVDLVKNSGKVVIVGNKTLYVAHVAINEEPYMVFSFVNKLKVPSWWSQLLKSVWQAAGGAGGGN